LSGIRSYVSNKIPTSYDLLPENDAYVNINRTFLLPEKAFTNKTKQKNTSLEKQYVTEHKIETRRTALTVILLYRSVLNETDVYVFIRLKRIVRNCSFRQYTSRFAPIVYMYRHTTIVHKNKQIRCKLLRVYTERPCVRRAESVRQANFRREFVNVYAGRCCRVNDLSSKSHGNDKVGEPLRVTFPVRTGRKLEIIELFIIRKRRRRSHPSAFPRAESDGVPAGRVRGGPTNNNCIRQTERDAIVTCKTFNIHIVFYSSSTYINI